MSDSYQLPPQVPYPPPPPAAPQKSKSNACLFGCLAFTLIFFLAIGGIGFYAYRTVTGMIETYTSTAPLEIPPVALAPEDEAALQERVDAFAATLDGAGTQPTLELTSDEVNALAATYAADGTIPPMHVEIVDDKLKGDISLPLDQFNMPGRFFNGSADVSVALANGRLIVYIERLQVGDQPVPDMYMEGFRNQDIAEPMLRENPELQAAISKLESITVKDGRIVLVAKEATAAPDSTDTTGDTAPAEIGVNTGAVTPDETATPEADTEIVVDGAQ